MASSRKRQRIVVYVCDPTDREHYRLEYVLPGTRLRRGKTAGTASPEEAERRRADWEYELNHGLGEEESDISWLAFREKFLEEHVAGLRVKTREQYVTVFSVFEKLGAPNKLADVDAGLLSRWVAKLRKSKTRQGKKGRQPWTVKSYLTSLMASLEWARKQGLISRLPEAPEVKVPRLRPKPVPEKEWELLLAVAPDEKWKAYLMCGWWAGLRLQEAYHLHWKSSEEWPSLDEGLQRVSLPARFVKADEDQWVPVHPKLKAALAGLPREGEMVFRFPGRGGVVMSSDAVAQKVRVLAEKAGVKLGMHKLRKGFACRVAQKLGRGGAPVLHRLMRHTSMQLTMQFYANVDDILQESIEEL